MSSAALPVKKKRVSKGPKGSTPSLSRKVSLEKVIGNTILHNSAFACNPTTGDLAYPAGCIIVIYSPKKNKQIKFLSNKENKAISFLRFSSNGKFLAVGESGHRPAVYVWDTSTWTIVSELRGHKFGVSCGCFSPNNKYLVTVGFQHDGSLYVWDWKAGTAAAGNKITTKVYAVSFSEDGQYFVTAGFRHIKFWYIDSIGATKGADKSTPKPTPGQTSVIEGRAGVLGAHKDSIMLDVVCGQGPAAPYTFCVTSKGLICQFNSSRVMDKWVNLKASSVFGITISPTTVACACSDGIVRLFDPVTLDYITTIHKPHAIGKEGAGPSNGGPGDVYPDALALQLSSDSQRLSVVYTDRTLTVWDVSNPKKSGLLRSFLAHCACIWDIGICPDKSPLPEGSFVTCGADNTIRVWNLDSALGLRASVSVDQSVSSVRAINKETLHTIHVDTSDKSDKSIFKAKDATDSRASSEMLPTVSNDVGVRCVALAADGKQLATGDRQGNLRVYSIPSFECVAYKEVHEAEILSLDYSKHPNTVSSSLEKKSGVYLATASRDRLVHVLDVNRNFDLSATQDDHSSSITAVKFAAGGTRLLTCSADKSIIFSTVDPPAHPGGKPSINRYHQVVVPYGTLYDLDVDPTQKYVVSVGQDKKLSIYTLNQPKVIRTYKTDLDSGEILKVSLDPAGIYAVTSCADRVLRVYDFYSGECIAKMAGHSELVTGVKFTRDCKRIISVSADGCIFVWKLSQDFTKSMKDRLVERTNAPPTPSPHAPSTPAQLPLGVATPMHNPPVSNLPTVSPISGGSSSGDDSFSFQPVPHGDVFGKDQGDVNFNDSVMPKFKFSETALPAWAKDERGKEKEKKGAGGASNPGKAKSRWAQRAANNEGITLYSELGEEDKPVVKLTENDKRRLTIEPDSLMAGDKWASPSMLPREASKIAKDLLISDMESTRPLPIVKSMEDDDAVMLDADGDDDVDPRMRATQVGALEDDDEEGEEKTEDEEEKDEGEGREEGEGKEEAIYFSQQGEENTKGFEVGTPTKKSRPEDEEEFEDASLKDQAKEDEEEAFRKMHEKYDFIKSNFDSLSIALTPRAQNPMRLSISKKFFEQPNRTEENQATPAASEETKSTKKAKEPLSKEVEKTRERLARMGIVLPSNKAAEGRSSSSEGQSSPTISTSSTPPLSSSLPLPASSTFSPPLTTTTTTLSSTASPQPPPARPVSTPPPPSQPRLPSPPPPQAAPSPPPSHLPSTTQSLGDTTQPHVAESTQFAQDSLRPAGTTLRRPLVEYESAMGSLAASMRDTIQLWREVRESAQSDPTAEYLSQQFQSLFSSISGQIAQVDPSATTNFSQAPTQLMTSPAPMSSSSDPLEKYSDLLVERVVQKLGSLDVQNRFLQSLTSSIKSSGSFL